MNRKTRNGLIAGVLAAGLSVALSTASVADLFKTSYTGSAWATEQIGTGNYKAVIADAVDYNKMIVSRDGAVDIVNYNGSQWVTTPDAAVGKTYNALTKQDNWSGFYYGSNAAGGIDKLTLYWNSAKGAMALNTSTIAATGAYKALASKASNNEEAMLAARDGALDYVYASGSWAVWGNILNNGRTYTSLASSANGGNLYYGIWSGGIDRIYYSYGWGCDTIPGTAGKGYTALQNDPTWDNYIFASTADGTMDKLQADGYGQWYISAVAGVNKAYTSLSPTSAQNLMYGTAPAVPEPGSLATLSLGCLSAIGMMLRRRVCSK